MKKGLLLLCALALLVLSCAHAETEFVIPCGGQPALTLRYDDDYQPEKTYIWVDSYKNVGANTWYVDGGKIAIGGVTFIRDKEI